MGLTLLGGEKPPLAKATNFAHPRAENLICASTSERSLSATPDSKYPFLFRASRRPTRKGGMYLEKPWYTSWFCEKKKRKKTARKRTQQQKKKLGGVGDNSFRVLMSGSKLHLAGSRTRPQVCRPGPAPAGADALDSTGVATFGLAGSQPSGVKTVGF